MRRLALASPCPIVAPASVPASPGFAGAPGGPRLRLGFRDHRPAQSGSGQSQLGEEQR